MSNSNKQLEAAEAAATKRGKGRDSLLLKAVLRFPKSKDEGEVRIRNLSEGGLMAETPARISRGEPVEVKLHNIGWITGHVAWVSEGRIGIAFDHPIDPKAARKPISATELDLPPHLKKLNSAAGQPSKYRRF